MHLPKKESTSKDGVDSKPRKTMNSKVLDCEAHGHLCPTCLCHARVLQASLEHVLSVVCSLDGKGFQSFSATGFFHIFL